MQVNREALKIIFNAGGHFVLAKEDKRPLWRSWGRHRPPLDLVQAHDGPLGVIPWSLRTTGLDVDHGDPSLLLEDHPAMAVLASRRPGRKHLYYHDTKGRRNGSFSVMGCSGETRGANGYLILWGHAPDVLADALTDPIARARTWPADLFEAAGVGAVTFPCAAMAPAYRPSPESRATWKAAAEAIGVDAEGFIVAAELTASSRDDASTLPALLDTIEVPIRRFTADGAYDHRSVYDQLSSAGTENVVIVIPPLVAPRCRRGQRTAHGRSVTRLLRGFARSGDESGRRSRATDSRRALKTASSDTSPCSEAD